MRNFSWQFYIFFELKRPGHRIFDKQFILISGLVRNILISNWLRRWSCCCCNYHTCTHYGSFLGLYIQNILVLFYWYHLTKSHGKDDVHYHCCFHCYSCWCDQDSLFKNAFSLFYFSSGYPISFYSIHENVDEMGWHMWFIFTHVSFKRKKLVLHSMHFTI